MGQWVVYCCAILFYAYTKRNETIQIYNLRFTSVPVYSVYSMYPCRYLNFQVTRSAFDCLQGSEYNMYHNPLSFIDYLTRAHDRLLRFRFHFHLASRPSLLFSSRRLALAGG